ncbi:MAG TPA: D-glycerate dehydrogenase [bacterium]|nr:D-glycerate dehydrogenase [bacterium]
MARPRVYVCRVLPDPAIEILRAVAEVRVWERDDVPPPREVLLREIAGCEGVLTLLTDRVDEEFLAHAPALRVVANMAVGYDNIDVPAATRRRVVVTNTPEVLTETTADFAFALILAAARRVVEADAFTRAGRWKTWAPLLLAGQDVHHATLGLIGLGRIGSAVARRARGFEMRVLYYDPIRRQDLEAQLSLEYRTLPEVLREADIISVHVPLTADTRHLIGAEQFKMMKPTAVFVNAARGPIVDQRALTEALRRRTIFAAGIDVFEQEPISPDDPLLQLDNVVVAPHIASASVPTRTRMATLAAENIAAVLQGRRPPTPVNPEVLA